MIDPVVQMLVSRIAFPVWAIVILIFVAAVATFAVPKLDRYPRAQGVAQVVSSVALALLKVLAGAVQAATGVPQVPDIDPKALYQAYHDSSGGLNYMGQSMPTWEMLPAKIQENWRAASRRAAALSRRRL